MALTISQNLINRANDDNAHITINDVVATANSVANGGDTLKVVANDGYAIVFVEMKYQSMMTGSITTINFTTDASRDFASVAVQSHWSGTPYFSSLQTEQAASDVLGTNNIYIATVPIMQEINRERFKTVGDSTIDFGQYILGLLQLPFEVDLEFIDGEKDIILGNWNTEIEAEKMLVDSYPLNLGIIEVPATNNNLLDFANVTCNLHLPLVGSVVVDSDYVIGETLEIEYLINLYDGNATINLKSSKVDGEVFFTKVSTLGIQVPYATHGTSAIVDNLNLSLGGENHIRTPFIELLKNDAVLPYGFFTVPIDDENLLNTANGFVQVQEIDLQVRTMTSEKNQILAMLNSGVIIK